MLNVIVLVRLLLRRERELRHIKRVCANARRVRALQARCALAREE